MFPLRGPDEHHPFVRAWHAFMRHRHRIHQNIQHRAGIDVGLQARERASALQPDGGRAAGSQAATGGAPRLGLRDLPRALGAHAGGGGRAQSSGGVLRLRAGNRENSDNAAAAAAESDAESSSSEGDGSPGTLQEQALRQAADFVIVGFQVSQSQSHSLQ